MAWKVMTNKAKPLLAVDMEQIGMLMWIIGVLVIALKLVLTANRQSGFVYAVELAGFASYAIGLLLIAVGILHVLRMHIKSSLATGPASGSRYAKPAALPLWYRPYGVASERQGLIWRRRTALRFDHGRASIWGVEYLIAAAIIQAAIHLSAQHTIWPQIGWLAVCIPLRTLLLAVHDQVTAHGHCHSAG